MDLLFFLALATAFKIGSGAVASEA